MHLPHLRTAFLVLLSAVLQAFAFPFAGPLPLWRTALAWVALVPLLPVLLGAASVRRAALLGYANGVLWYLLTCYWVYATMHTYGGLSPATAVLALVLMCLYLALYHALFAALFAWVGRLGTPLVWLATPFLWVAVELARARVTSFPWNLLGYAQVDSHMLTRLAPLTGVYGLSFVLAAGNAAFAAALLLPQRQRRLAVLLVTAGGILVVQWSDRMWPAVPVLGTSTAILLQPNLQVGVGQMPPDTLAQSSSQLTQQAALLQQQPPSVLLWPESPSPFATDRAEFTGAASALAQALHAPLIAGAVGVAPPQYPERTQRVYNSAVLFRPSGEVSRYDKIHLVPFGEFTPYANLFQFASGLTEAVGNFSRGTSRAPLDAAGHRFGTFLCYESIFGDEVRQFALAGADVLVNLSDDGWYGDSSAPFQHLNMARMRAIENRRWLLRDTNTGVTATIAPDGRVMETMPRHRRGAAVMHFSFVNGTTFYTRHGDLFAYGCALVTVCLAAAATRRKPHDAVN